MDFSLQSLLELARFTVQNPRAAARSLMAMRLPDAARWILFGFVVTASAFLTHVSFNLLPQAETNFMGNAMANPVQTALIQGFFLLLTVATVYGVGRSRGGTGSFSDTLLLIGWLQVVLLCIQAAQILALVVIPPVAEILGIVGLGLSFWLLTQFIVELHGFASAWRVFAGIIGVIFAAAFVLSVVFVTIYGAGA